MMLATAALLLSATALAGPAVTAGGALRAELVGDRLDDLYAETPDADAGLAFALSRARVGLDARLSERVSARVALDAAQQLSASTYTTAALDAVAVQDYPSGFALRAVDAWGRWSSEPLGAITAGLMRHCFGVRCSYDRADGFYFGGVGDYPAMAQRIGLIEDRVLGLRWERDLGGWAGVMVMASDRSPVSTPERVAAKDATARLDVWPLAERLRITGSAIFGPAGDPGGAYEPWRLAWSGSAVAHLWGLRALVEALGQTEGGASGLGWNANLGGDIGLSGDLDHLELLARVERWEPDLETADDRSVSVAAATNLYWASTQQSAVMTGLLYTVLAPEDRNAAIEHRATLQARLDF